MQPDTKHQEELASLRLELAELRQQLAATEADQSVRPSNERSTRRGILRLAGAAAVGGAAALVGSNPAAAATGAMQFGASNNAGADKTTLIGTGVITMEVQSTANAALRGTSTGPGTGLFGDVQSPASNAYGVWGFSAGSLGYGVVAEGGQAQLMLEPSFLQGPSANVFHRIGEIAYDSTTSALWACVGAGTPGTWRKLAGSTTSGSFHAVSPSRVYDSRKAQPGPQSVLATGASRTVSVADGRDTGTGAVTAANVVPAGATAVAYNLTVVNTVGTNGFLAVNEGGNTTIAASIINWSASGLVLANSSVVKLNGSRQMTVICGGNTTSCNFIVDVLGYYL